MHYNTFAFLYILSKFVVSEVIYEARPEANEEWWQHATFYQIYPKSFKDSNGDGIGDLQGIISKLDHLVNAGITATWISPIYKSPGVDAGYDISDYRNIDEQFGTMADFEELIATATQLGLKIIMDFVPNHTSDEHDWFKLSLNKTAGYEDFYVWVDGESTTPPNNWLSNFKYSAWNYSQTRKQFYYHAFAEQQPDLNYSNPSVVKEMKDVLIYWLDKGVAGFRIDAVGCLFESEGLENEPVKENMTYDVYNYQSLDHIYTLNLPETFDMVYQWRALMDNYTKQNGGDTRVIMTEAYENYTTTFRYYGNDTTDGAHFSFNFFFISELQSNFTAQNIVDIIKKWFLYMPSNYTANWVLGNHDRHRVASRFGKENADGFNMLTTLLPGVAVTYNGEEIGMEDGEVTWEQGDDPSACNGNESDFDSLSRDFERTPFHWNNATNAGFSTANSTWLPVSSKYLQNNLLHQSAYGVKSHFHVYQALMKLRKEDTFIYGSLNIEIIDTNVMAYTRELSGNDTYVFAFNSENTSVTIDLSVFESLGSYIKTVILSSNSEKDEGDVLSVSNIQMEAHEAIVAKKAEVSSGATSSVFITISINYIIIGFYVNIVF